MGLPLPRLAPLEEVHGPLMICGVFGTLISLERAVAIGSTWPYVAPACFALAAVALISGAPIDAAGALAVLGSAGLVAASLWIVGQQRALFTAVLLLAALMLLLGSAFWFAGSDVRAVVGWWLGFLTCTIAAERLELSRVIPPSRFSQGLFIGAISLVVIGAAMSLESELGSRILGAGFLSIAAWLVRHDVATRTVRMRGQPRYMAAAMLAGYLWLAVAGLHLVLGPAGPFAYDLTLHALLIGFVLSMVLGHALIIFPAVSGLALRYRPILYLPLGLLHLSVAVRVLGNVLDGVPLRLTSGPLTAVSLILFVVLIAAGARTRRGTSRASPSPRSGHQHADP